MHLISFFLAWVQQLTDTIQATVQQLQREATDAKSKVQELSSQLSTMNARARSLEAEHQVISLRVLVPHYS